ncbi:flagellin [Paucibacter sp. PLA-PC-4]|uniref:flagellin N-terminal helical domain-containing protein n=1 Tax=Paucibacter sp. PLA-PC-4 TaxID=2993655 RepID=UPI0022493CFB|nr:flagellin [Paucibacter sp. PLA-PC-4]MCX2861721.1 flagellin [Paucibacter sp. PLA-PC-4]
MLSLHTNAAALSTQGSLGKTQNALSTSMTRLGTGLRVNSAMDDAAGLQIATRLNAQTRGMAVAQRNAQNGISMLQTAEGALDEVSNIVLRMKDLATEGASGTATAKDLTAMKAEFDDLGNELTNILTNTKFGGEALLAVGGKLELAAGVTFQIGSDKAETYKFDASTQVKAVATDVGLLKANTFADSTTANAAIDLANTVLDSVGAARAKLGAGANRLDHVNNNLQNMVTNVTQAKGRIMDTDYAKETSNMTTKQMLMQASSSMLKQSNSMSGMVMSLLQ